MAKGIKGGYRLPGATSLSVVRQGPFKVLRRIGKLAYELELPPHIKIHPVISVIHLEPAFEDPYHRDRPKPGPILVGDDEEYTIQKIVDHELRKGDTFYRIRWMGYNSDEDTWEPGDYIQRKLPELVKRYERGLPNELERRRAHSENRA
jgi:hypothetical protein